MVMAGKSSKSCRAWDHDEGEVVILEGVNVHGLQWYGHGQEAIVAVDEALQG